MTGCEITVRIELLPIPFAELSLLPVSRGRGVLLRLENPERLLIMAHRLFWLLLRGEHPR